MAEWYTWTHTSRLWLTFLLALCVLDQTLTVVLSWFRHPRNRTRICENILEAAILVQIFACSLVHGQAMHSYELGLVTPSGYIALRYAACAASAAMALIVAGLLRNPWPLAIIAASASVLPAMEGLGSAFAYLYLATLAFWLLRSTHICILRYGEIRSSLSVLSIKNAIDSLHSGVMFGEQDGFILLANAQMQRLMLVISGRVRRNGWFFYQRLEEGEVQPGCRTAELEGQIVCLLPDQTAWMFTKSELHIHHKKYIQLTATDITLRWDMTERLQRQEQALQHKGEQLKQAIAGLHTLCRQRETQRAKMRAHDILGERLALLLQAVRNGESLDSDMLLSLRGLIDELKAGPGAPCPQGELNTMQQAFGTIGVEVALDGELPPDNEAAMLLVDIIREGVSNAVRHAYATRVAVRISRGNGSWQLVLTDNGQPPRGRITEGGGISGMRRRVEQQGGALDIAPLPRFELTVDLPGGMANG